MCHQEIIRGGASNVKYTAAGVGATILEVEPPRQGNVVLQTTTPSQTHCTCFVVDKFSINFIS